MLASIREGFRFALATAIPAALGLGLLETWQAKGATLAALSLWLLLGLALALALGLVMAGGIATFGSRFIQRALATLGRDASADTKVTAWLLAAGALVAPAALVIAKAALLLVADVQRKQIGALLLGLVAVAIMLALVPLMPLAYQATKHVARLVPRFGAWPRTASLLAGASALLLAAVAHVVFRKLDWRVLQLGSLVALLALPVLAAGLGMVLWGPLDRVRQGLPGRALLPWGLGILGLAGAVLVFVRTPNPADVAALADHGLAAPRLIPALRALRDRDGDGHSGFWHGPDCNEGNPAIHPGAKEVPGNGIDDNCVGGDGRSLDSQEPDASATAPTQPVQPAAAALAGGKNVLIVFVDTLRFDRMGFAGYQRDGKSLTPRLDAMAQDATVFRRAYAQSPNTPRSVPSFLTSRYPSHVKVNESFANYPTVAEENEFLFEVLQQAGHQTLGMTSHFYFCSPKTPEHCAGFADKRNTQVQQGATLWDNAEAVDIAPSNKDIAAPRIIAKANAKLAELAKAKTPWTMLVHLFEPHSTYVEHEGMPPITEKGSAALAQKYDYEIAYTDQWLGKLFDAVHAQGLDDQTIVVVMSDHGEAFGLHEAAGQRMFFHGQTLYNELLHVPLLIKVPGQAARNVTDVVGLIDVAPTILDLLGLAPPASWQGRTLVPAIRGEALTPRPVFAELLPAPSWKHEAKAMITADGKHKVYFRQSDQRWEIYDLEADPNETKNLEGQAPERLKAELLQFIEQ